MHRASAVPSRHGGSGAGMRRLSIHADSRSVDLCLSAAIPIGSLIPSIVDVLARNGDFHTGPLAVRYRLSFPGGVALDPSKTLSQTGIRDGAVLLLTSTSTELLAPRFDDAADAVSASVAAMERRWTPRRARLVGSLVATWLAGVTAAVLTRTALDTSDARRAGSLGAAATIALLTLLAAALAYRACRENSAGLTLGMLATGFAALAGLLAVPGEPGAPKALFATVAAATSAAAMRVITDNALAFTALATFAATEAVAALVGTVAAIPLQAIGAASTAISLGLVEAAPWLSIMLARLSPQLPPPSEGMNAKVIRAHTWLTSLVIAFAASATLGAVGAAIGPCLTGAPRWRGIVFAGVTGAVLLLRARAHRDVAIAISLVIGGTATLGAVLVAAAAAYPSYTPHIAAASMLLGTVALCLGIIDDATTISPLGQRSVELLEYLAFAVVVPLAFWICGLYGAARALNLS